MFFNDVKAMIKAGVLADIASGADDDRTYGPIFD
jgi:hypothetical protein